MINERTSPTQISLPEMRRTGELSKGQAREKGNTSPACKAAKNALLTLLLGTTKLVSPAGSRKICVLV